MIDSRLMRVFLAVYHARSVGQASKELNLTQPAVSKAIRRLEGQLETPLFERDARGMSPTPFAEALLGHAEMITAEIATAEAEIAALRGVAKGRIKVGATPSLVVSIVPAVLTRLLAAKGLIAEVREGIEDDLMQALARREIDLALLGNMRRLRDQPFIVEELLNDEVSVVCRPGHPLQGAGPTALARLLDYPWALPERDNVMWRRLSEVFYAAGLDPPEATVKTSSATLMKALAAEGDFLTFLPRQLIAGEADRGMLTVLTTVPEAAWRRQVVAVRLQRATLPLPARAFIQTLRETVAAPSDRRFATD